MSSRIQVPTTIRHDIVKDTPFKLVVRFSESKDLSTVERMRYNILAGNPNPPSWAETRRPLLTRETASIVKRKKHSLNRGWLYHTLRHLVSLCHRRSLFKFSSSFLERSDGDRDLIFELPAAVLWPCWPPEGGERVYPGLNGSMAC